KGDIALLYRKFAVDFAEKYHRPVVRLTPEAQQVLIDYAWPGNIRQLRNFTEEISVVESDVEINEKEIIKFLPTHSIVSLKRNADGMGVSSAEFNTEREILYKFLFDMKKDLNDLRALTMELLSKTSSEVVAENRDLVNRILNPESKVTTDSLLHYEVP